MERNRQTGRADLLIALYLVATAIISWAAGGRFHLHYEVRVVPPGGPKPKTNPGAFFETGLDPKIAVNPNTFEWPELTPPTPPVP